VTVAVSVQRRHRPSADDVLVFFVSRPPTPRSYVNVVVAAARPTTDVLVFSVSRLPAWYVRRRRVVIDRRRSGAFCSRLLAR